jgi:hypothetical protein
MRSCPEKNDNAALMRQAKVDLLKSYGGQAFAFLLGTVCDDRGEPFAHHLRKEMISNYLRDPMAHGL